MAVPDRCGTAARVMVGVVFLSVYAHFSEPDF
jgi:hypothetical protein